MRIPVTLTAVALALGIVAAANSQVYKPTGGGSGLSSITAGTTPTTGCGAAGVLFSASSLVQCDTGFTYAGAGGNIAFTGSVSGPATGAAATTTYNFGTPGTGLFGNTTSVQVAAGGGTVAQFTAGAFNLTNGSQTTISAFNLGWNANDTTISRSAAGTLRIGTALNSAAGNLLASGFGPGTIYSAAGTPAPACAAGTNGWTIVASDITTATYRTLYVSGGANTGRLFCVSGTGWLSD